MTLDQIRQLCDDAEGLTDYQWLRKWTDDVVPKLLAVADAAGRLRCTEPTWPRGTACFKCPACLVMQALAILEAP